MYYFDKQWRTWLMVMPFLIMHVLGSRSLFSMYGLFNVRDGLFDAELHVCYERAAESNFPDSECVENTCIDQKKAIVFLDDSFKSLKRQKKDLSKRFFVCDNRIDKMNQTYSTYLSEVNVDLNENSFLSVV